MNSEFINRLEQLGWVDYDVLLTDPKGFLPDSRFHVSIASDDDTEARKEEIVVSLIDQVKYQKEQDDLAAAQALLEQQILEEQNGDINL